MNIVPTSENYWKWIATTGAVFTLSIFTMGAGWFYDTRNQPTSEQIMELRAELAVVQDRQNQVLTRLAVLESEIVALQDELRRHEEDVVPQP